MTWVLLLLFAGDFETNFKAGLVALNENHLASAESQLQAASQLQPRNPQVWLALAQTYWKERKLPEAAAAAKNAEMFGKDPLVLHGLGFYYSQSGDYTKAAELLQAAVRAKPFEESYYFDLAQLHLTRQNFAAALEVIDAGRKNFDKSAQLELAAGVSYYGLRRFPDAIDAFLRTLRIDPSVEQPYVFLGRMLDQAEDRLPRIVTVFETLAKNAPDNYLGSFLYGKALMVDDPAQAEALLRKSIARNPEFWESHFDLGVLLEQKKNFEEAAKEVRRAADLNAEDPMPHYRLARLYDRLGMPAEARTEREQHARLAGVK